MMQTKIFTHETLSIGYRDEGKGLPVIILAGWGYGSNLGEVVYARSLREMGYRTITIDVPGVGVMDAKSSFVHIPRISRTVAALLRELGCNESTVIGHSFGALVAQELALSEDDVVSRLVLFSVLQGLGGLTPDLSTSMDMLNKLMAGEMEGLSDFFAPMTFAKIKSLLGDLFKELEKPGAAAVLSGQVWAASRWTNFGRLSRIYQPTMIVHGQEDPLCPPEGAKILAHHIKNSELHVLPCGYMPALEQREAVLSLIKTFLSTEEEQMNAQIKKEVATKGDLKKSSPKKKTAKMTESAKA